MKINTSKFLEWGGVITAIASTLLLAFNIGVELGQLSVLIIAFSIFSIILKKNWQSDHIRIPASLIIGVVGLFWFIERIFSF